MYKCTLCEARFYSAVDCRKHVENTHPDQTAEVCQEVQYKCGHCGLTFGHRTDVKNHALREHGLQSVEVIEEPLPQPA